MPDFQVGYTDEELEYEFDNANQVHLCAMPDKQKYKSHFQQFPIRMSTDDAVETFRYLLERGWINKVFLSGNSETPGYMSEIHDSMNFPKNSPMDRDFKAWTQTKEDWKKIGLQAAQTMVLKSYADLRVMKGPARNLTEQQVLEVISDDTVSSPFCMFDSIQTQEHTNHMPDC